jgi:hypothetical protein
MLNSLKRYALAFALLIFVIIMMLAGTLGVKSFGDKMFEDANITIHPEGERLKL